MQPERVFLPLVGPLLYAQTQKCERPNVPKHSGALTKALALPIRSA